MGVRRHPLFAAKNKKGSGMAERKRLPVLLAISF